MAEQRLRSTIKSPMNPCIVENQGLVASEDGALMLNFVDLGLAEKAPRLPKAASHFHQNISINSLRRKPSTQTETR